MTIFNSYVKLPEGNMESNDQHVQMQKSSGFDSFRLKSMLQCLMSLSWGPPTILVGRVFAEKYEENGWSNLGTC